MLHYVNGPMPVHILPMLKHRHRKMALFAKRGALAKESYNWDVLMAHVDELKVSSSGRVDGARGAAYPSLTDLLAPPPPLADIDRSHASFKPLIDALPLSHPILPPCKRA